MAYLNEVRLIGNVGSVELRHSNGGDAVLSFSLATSARWKDADGTAHERTEWHRCSLWGKRATALEPFVKVGARLFVAGELRYRESEKDGVKRTHAGVHVFDVQLLDRKPRESGAGTSGAASDGDDDIPF